MYGTARATAYGYSLWEFQVFGTPGRTPRRTRPSPAAARSAPNVMVFDPSMSTADIQAKLDSVFAKQESNQFGTQRYALLFKPGTYSASTPTSASTPRSPVSGRTPTT